MPILIMSPIFSIATNIGPNTHPCTMAKSGERFSEKCRRIYEEFFSKAALFIFGNNLLNKLG